MPLQANRQPDMDSPEGAAAPSSSLLHPGDLAITRADAGLGIVLPDGKRLQLNGKTVKILDVRLDNSGRMLLIQPQPWEFWDGAWPSGWWASEKYFEVLPCP